MRHETPVGGNYDRFNLLPSEKTPFPLVITPNRFADTDNSGELLVNVSELEEIRYREQFPHLYIALGDFLIHRTDQLVGFMENPVQLARYFQGATMLLMAYEESVHSYDSGGMVICKDLDRNYIETLLSMDSYDKQMFIGRISSKTESFTTALSESIADQVEPYAKETTAMGVKDAYSLLAHYNVCVIYEIESSWAQRTIEKAA